eukprot:CAMPEP_0181330448 /NCGR_PEP_ID=MMETSP1101-20121128/23906_1 /TAXON_ID=46948 /ORGANISM="Rhodomonas abbreviata, Strain Caron Lab Isolate" /LENGTH=232 /DNA_ID=CAMNT_0023439707 /DNA_START=285 /DNA_END=979 /DNA_ORIENTATION=+
MEMQAENPIRTRRDELPREALPHDEQPISRSRRRIFVVCMAIVGCVAVLALASNKESSFSSSERPYRVDELLQSPSSRQARSTSSVVQPFGAHAVIQQLATFVERVEDNAHLFGDEVRGPVVLEEQTLAAAAAAPCDAACHQKKVMIANKMKSLRDQINRDFSSMINFGHKAGYLPPPESIRKEVMDGTLLGGKSKTGANAVAPPAFKENVSPSLLKSSTISASSSSSSSSS